MGRATTANFFDVLGVRPVAGRIFTEDEDRTGAPVAIISYALWQRRYAGSADVINRDILINGLKSTIIGVMPRDFAFRDREMDFWIPIHFLAGRPGRPRFALPQCGGAPQSRACRWHRRART